VYWTPGVLLCQKRFGTFSGIEYATDMLASAEKQTIVAGYTNSFGSNGDFY
jgi:hypothetical protein